MALIDLNTVKTEFEQWEKFVRLLATEDAATLDARLQRKIDAAEARIFEYIPQLPDAAVTGALKNHLMNIVRKMCFDIQHGDTAFENPPQIIKDYDATVETLERWKELEFSLNPQDSEQKDISITAKKRRFTEWFLSDPKDITEQSS